MPCSVIPVSQQFVQTQLLSLRMEGVAATFVSLILGCDSLGMASLVLAALQSRTLQIGRILPAKCQTCCGMRLVREARVTVS